MIHPHENILECYQRCSAALQLPTLGRTYLTIKPEAIAPQALRDWLKPQIAGLQGGWLAWEQDPEHPLFATNQAEILQTQLETIQYPHHWPLEGELYGEGYTLQLAYQDGLMQVLTLTEVEDTATAHSGQAVLYDDLSLRGKKQLTPGSLRYRCYWQPTAQHGFRPFIARLCGFKKTLPEN